MSKCLDCNYIGKMMIGISGICCPKCGSPHIDVDIIEEKNPIENRTMNRTEFVENLKDTFKMCLGLVDKKNVDYASSEDPFLNFRSAELNGIATIETALLVRMQDKWARIINLIKHDRPAKVEDETVDDTILDMINYLAILRAYRKSKRSTYTKKRIMVNIGEI